MDNKRWYSRFGTIFWWSFAILPLIAVLIEFIGYHLTFNSGISTSADLIAYQSASQGSFIVIFKKNLEVFSSFEISYLRTMFVNLFQRIGVNQFESSQYLAPLFAWMTSVAFYHVLFDFSVWIFNWIHSLFERWGCFK